MKRLLTILGAVGLTATTGATVVACGTKDPVTSYGFLTDTNEALTTVLKEYQDKIVDVKDLTYKDFFHMDDKEGTDNYNFLQDKVYDQVTAKLKTLTKGGTGEDKDQLKYDQDQIAAELAKVLTWSQDAMTLVYADVKDYGLEPEKQKQEVLATIAEGEDKTLETLFVDAVKEYYKDDFQDTTEWWEAHARATIALQVKLDLHDVKLGEGAKELLTFTFKQAWN